MVTYDEMEFMVIGYLRDIRRRYNDWDACKERIREAREALELSAVVYSGMPGSPNAYGDAIPDGIASLEERCAAMRTAIAEHGAAIDRAWELCRPAVSENRYCLWLHYVQGMEWRAVSRALFVSERAIYRMRADGIIELHDILQRAFDARP